MNIALIGPRGVGKSKVSRKLSKLLSMPIVSTDMIAVYEAGGISIAEQIKKENGKWNNFRKLEFKILENLSKSRNIILDCGGGILFDVDRDGKEFYSEKKTNLLKSFCTVIGLSNNIDYLVEKVINDTERPQLSEINSYREVLERRIPFYKAASDFYLPVDGLEPKDIAKKISELI
ncbi:MAG TPA: shikimate kinase [Leptospiraceae bacterium]|nr:shikimate kinase [Leptospiraceae bacterium]HMW03761.1 shikimate kinase [Leptospiraceae bacterium]HMX31874.1 shikimate kinase [Leptospiraceae bacterium]HMY29741.1 shikimate kinase [Leptospiraceae bacterium]HMZ62860.1 shikimate kinase [Leptospiraceae bacterium]